MTVSDMQITNSTPIINAKIKFDETCIPNKSVNHDKTLGKIVSKSRINRQPYQTIEYFTRILPFLVTKNITRVIEMIKIIDKSLRLNDISVPLQTF